MPDSKEIFARNIMLYGLEGFERLQKSFVAIVGLGGVGSYAAEALVRAGIGKIRLIDCDLVKPSDVNRQLIALSVNLNRPKVEAARERLKAINSNLVLDSRHAFFHADTADELISGELNFVIDAIDSLSPKGELIRHCLANGIRVISALGAAARTDPFQIRLSNLDETSICPLARGLRRYLHTRKIDTHFPVVYSTERPIEPHRDFAAPITETSGTYIRGRRRRALPSLATLPAIFGLIAANYVILELLRKSPTNPFGSMVP